MRSIRRYLYAALLALTTINVAPTMASAQDPVARGRFTLPHEVYWENAVVPAGNYRFSIDSDSIGVLRIDKVSGAPAGFMFLIRKQEAAQPSDINRLILESTDGTSYVSAMQLPDFGITLNFTVPASTPEKQLANAATMHLRSGQ